MTFQLKGTQRYPRFCWFTRESRKKGKWNYLVFFHYNVFLWVSPQDMFTWPASKRWDIESSVSLLISHVDTPNVSASLAAEEMDSNWTLINVPVTWAEVRCSWGHRHSQTDLHVNISWQSAVVGYNRYGMVTHFFPPTSYIFWCSLFAQYSCLTWLRPHGKVKGEARATGHWHRSVSEESRPNGVLHAFHYSFFQLKNEDSKTDSPVQWCSVCIMGKENFYHFEAPGEKQSSWRHNWNKFFTTQLISTLTFNEVPLQ